MVDSEQNTEKEIIPILKVANDVVLDKIINEESKDYIKENIIKMETLLNEEFKTNISNSQTKKIDKKLKNKSENKSKLCLFSDECRNEAVYVL